MRAAWASLAVVVIGGALAAPAAAAPSKFVYEMCDSALPGGGVPSNEFHNGQGTTAYSELQNCASPGGWLGITETGEVNANYSWLEIGVPETPGGFVESDTISTIAYGWSPGNHLSHVYAEGWPGDEAGESQRTFHIRSERNWYSNGGGFNIVMSCDGNVGTCYPGGVIAAHDIAATEVDPVPPRLKAISGSMLEGGILRGHQEIAAEATDVGGGLTRLEVLVNGLPGGAPAVGNCNVAEVANHSYEGLAAASPTPCPPALSGSWLLDTGAYPFHEGTNSVEVCATDFSTLTEANKTCSPAQSVTVDDSCTESSVAGGQVISADFAESHEEDVTVPYMQPADVVGELSNEAGDAIAGATICVKMETEGSGGGLQPVGTATTDSEGQFSYPVPPGPNRKVFVGYRHNTFQVARAVRYFAHAGPTLKVRPGKVVNGAAIEMWGTVPGEPSTASGRVVVLQASALHSKRWFTFRRATTDEQGVFHARYRFDATPQTTTFRFRAVVPPQQGYPWEVGHSKPVLVLVRGHRRSARRCHRGGHRGHRCHRRHRGHRRGKGG